MIWKIDMKEVNSFTSKKSYSDVLNTNILAKKSVWINYNVIIIKTIIDNKLNNILLSNNKAKFYEYIKNKPLKYPSYIGCRL